MLDGGLTLAAAAQRMQDGARALVLENDLHRRMPAAQIELGNAVVLDALETPTAEAAAIVLPAATYAEQTGTFVNYEARAQRFYQVFEPTEETVPSWRWLAAIGRLLGRDADWEHIDDLTAACATGEFAPLAELAPGANFRVRANAKIPRQPHRYSGRTAMRAHINIHEPKAAVDEETPLAYSMEGQNVGDQPGAVVPYVWTPGWNSNQSVFKFQQEVGGPLAGGDPGVCLLTGGERASKPAAATVPQEVASNGAYVAARVYHVFGSDELSGASAPILERTPAPFVLLNSADAKELRVAEGGGVVIDELRMSAEVRLDDAVQRGVVGVAQGLPGAGVLDTATVHLAADPDFVRSSTGDSNVIARG